MEMDYENHTTHKDEDSLRPLNDCKKSDPQYQSLLRYLTHNKALDETFSKFFLDFVLFENSKEIIEGDPFITS